MTLVIGAVITLGLLGMLFGYALAVASQRFKVEENPRFEALLEALPGSNCGACGYAGCAGYAKALADGTVGDVTLCAPGGNVAAHDIARILGVEPRRREPRYAVLLCTGGHAVADKFGYQGVRDCAAASLVLGGTKVCEYGCVGLGTCAAACPYDAIRMGDDGLPIIFEERCTGCGICVAACPKRVLRCVPESKMVHVNCISQDKGAVTKKLCPTGCIACKKCERVCTFDAIQVKDSIAVINYNNCTSCGDCVAVCPSNTISDMSGSRKILQERQGRVIVAV